MLGSIVVIASSVVIAMFPTRINTRPRSRTIAKWINCLCSGMTQPSHICKIVTNHPKDR